MASPDEEEYLHGHPAILTHVQKHVMNQANANQALRQCLHEGGIVVSTYHAQLGVDRLRQLDELSTLQTELEDIKKEEVRLEGRIDFLFHDCRRLEADNQVIMSGFVDKDASTNDVRRLLRLEGEKFEEVSRKTAHVQDEVLATSKQLVELKGELRHSKRLRVDKRNASWDSMDDIGRIEECIAMVKEEMAHLTKRLEATRSAQQQRLLQQQEELKAMQQQQRRTAASTVMSSSLLRADPLVSAGRHVLSRSGITATSTLSDARANPQPTTLSPPTSSVAKSQRHGGANSSAQYCKRPDCIAVAFKLAELSDDA